MDRLHFILPLLMNFFSKYYSLLAAGQPPVRKGWHAASVRMRSFVFYFLVSFLSGMGID
jgi:hypothetical protein